MARRSRIVFAAVLLGLGLGLSGCETAGDWLADLDPFGVNKKTPLPGERKQVFPEGVPGVTQGVPPELKKGAQQTAVADPSQPGTPDTAAGTEEAAAAAPPPKPPPKKKAAAKPKPKPPAQAAAPAEAAPPQQSGWTAQPPAQSGWTQPAQPTVAWPTPPATTTR